MASIWLVGSVGTELPGLKARAKTAPLKYATPVSIDLWFASFLISAAIASTIYPTSLLQVSSGYENTLQDDDTNCIT